jgi:DNA polymerase
MIRLDYETRSRSNLKKVGVWRYAEDPSTQILCFAYRINGGRIKSWRMGQKLPRDFCDAIRAGDQITAFNADFERAITELVGKKLGMPIPKLSQWVDTQAIALMCSLPASLGVLAEVLGVDEQKDKEGTRLIRKFSMPQRNGHFIDPEDDPEDFDKFVAYCEQDVVTEESVADAMPVRELPAIEQKIWRMDSRINKRGIPMDRLLLAGAIKIERRGQQEARTELTRLTKNCRVKVTAPGQTQKLKALAEELKYGGLPNLKKETIEVCLTDAGLPPLLRRVLRIRQRTAQAAVKKYYAAAGAVCRDGNVKSVHRYHGAHTGRWTAGLLQTQNLARPKIKLDDTDNDIIRAGDYDSLECLYDDPMSVLRDAVRHIIRAIEGEKLIVCDLASIEARVLGWLASDPKYLKAFRDGLDLYKVTAAEIFGVSYDDVDEDQRWVGKQSVLALGYSMGVDTFYDHCVKYQPQIKKSLLARAVKAYRKTYYRIVNYWKAIEVAAVRAVIQPGSVTEAGCVSFKMVKGYLTMRLPSGRALWYPGAKIVRAKTSWGEEKSVVSYMTCIKKRLWVRKTTYGGRLTENAVQAIARDILAHGMLLMEAGKMLIRMHVHDEAVTSVKKSVPVQRVTDCLTAVPAWAPGIPLGAKGFETIFYKKD